MEPVFYHWQVVTHRIGKTMNVQAFLPFVSSSYTEWGRSRELLLCLPLFDLWMTVYPMKVYQLSLGMYVYCLNLYGFLATEALVFIISIIT